MGTPYTLRNPSSSARSIRATLAILGRCHADVGHRLRYRVDVENLSFAVLDRDDTTLGRDYVQQIAGSRYFVEKPPDQYADLDRRMRDGEISLAYRNSAGLRARYCAREQDRRNWRLDRRRDGKPELRLCSATFRACAIWLTQKAREHYGAAAAVLAIFRLLSATATIPASKALWPWCRRSSRSC